MFTGIIESMGTIRAIERRSGDARVFIHGGGLDLSDVAVGDSIAVSGVCLTATRIAEGGFWVDVSGETLSLTILGSMQTGDEVNLEKALTPSTRLGGHLVSGHVDGVGEVLQRRPEGRSVRFVISVPAPLARYVAARGSVCLDGVSLTVNEVSGATFGINIIPHTMEMTTIRHYREGTRLNVEVDLVARYLERLLLGERAADRGAPVIDHSFLAEHGFIDHD